MVNRSSTLPLGNGGLQLQSMIIPKMVGFESRTISNVEHI